MANIFLKQNLNKAKSQSSKSYTEATLFPILGIDKLLPEIEKNHYLNKIQEIVSLPNDYFKVIYEDLIDSFALFVQVLPEVYGEELGGLLNDGLRRGFLALQLLRENQESKPHPLFVFAVFSIALLADLGQILNYHVNISDEKGAFIDDWHPYLGPMSEFGEFYKLRPYENTPQSLIRSSTPLFARQLLNETALTWLTSNNQIFDMWLAFLNKGDDWAGGLARILKIDPRQFESRKGEGIIPIDVKYFDPLGTDLGEKFWAWLKNGLEDGTISFNESDSKVHLVKVNNGLDLSVFLQAPELFQQFCNVYLKMRDWVVVSKQFNYLGLAKLSGDDVKFEQFFSENADLKGKLGFLTSEKTDKKSLGQQTRGLISAQNFKEGLLVKDAKMLFGNKVPGVSQYLKEVELRWGQDNVLPKIRTSGENNLQLSVKPQK